MAIIEGGKVIEGARERPGRLATKASAAFPSSAAMKWARFEYDFAVQGGAVGTLALAGATVIPLSAIILGGILEVLTVPTSAGAPTVALQAEAADDIIAAALISGAPWSTLGRKNTIPSFDGATSVKLTAARDLSAVIAVAALTAGKFNVYVAYIETV